MDSGNIKTPAGLSALIADTRGGRQNQSVDQNGGEGGGFAALIASILSNGKMSQASKGGADGAQSVAPEDGVSPAANPVPAGPVAGGAAKAKAPSQGVGNPQAVPQEAGRAALPPGAAAKFDKLIRAASTPTYAAATPGGAGATPAAGKEGKAAATATAISSGDPAPPGDEGRSANAAAANTAHTGHAGQAGKAGGAYLQKDATAAAINHDKPAGGAVDAKAAAPQGAPAGVETVVKAADAASSAAAKPAGQPASAQSIVQQVAQNLTLIAGNGVDRLRFQLHPAELGQVSVQLRIREGVARVVISAEHPAAIEAMRHAAGSLQQALQNTGLQVGREGLQFDLQQHNQQPQEHHADADPDRRKDQNTDDGDGLHARDSSETAAATPERRADAGLFL